MSAASSPTEGAAMGCQDGDRCVVCSDQMLEARVIEMLDGGLALVEVDGTREEVSVALVSVTVGDSVLIHAKEAISVVGGRP